MWTYAVLSAVFDKWVAVLITPGQAEPCPTLLTASSLTSSASASAPFTSLCCFACISCSSTFRQTKPTVSSILPYTAVIARFIYIPSKSIVYRPFFLCWSINVEWLSLNKLYPKLVFVRYLYNFHIIFGLN